MLWFIILACLAVAVIVPAMCSGSDALASLTIEQRDAVRRSATNKIMENN